MTKPAQAPHPEFDAWWAEARKSIQLRRDDWPHQVATAAWNAALDAERALLEEARDALAELVFDMHEPKCQCQYCSLHVRLARRLHLEESK